VSEKKFVPTMKISNFYLYSHFCFKFRTWFPCPFISHSYTFYYVQFTSPQSSHR